jgi:hypothetical protein
MVLGVLLCAATIAVAQITFVSGGNQVAAPTAPNTNSTANPNAQARVSYSAHGTVVNSLTGDPIPHALVEAQVVVVRGTTSMMMQRAAFTDSNGEFTLDDMPDGTRTGIQAFKPGFFSVAENQGPQPILNVGPNIAPVKVLLTPQATIVGHVVDQDGDPVQGASVFAKCARLFDGRKQWNMCSSSGTDEDGSFRLSRLQPGSYYLMATVNGQALRSRDSSEVHTGYAPAYYPTTRLGSKRATFEVRAGAKTEVNIVVHKTRMFDVYGNVVGIVPNQPAGVQLMTRDDEAVPAAVQLEAQSGTFVIHNVPSGDFMLQASADDGHGHPISARVPITVARDVTNVTLALRAAATIPVIVHAELTHDPAQMGTMSIANVQVRPGTPVVNVCLRSIDTGLGFAQYCSNMEMKDDLPSLELRGVEPGRYSVEVMPLGAGMVYASAINYDGKDVTNEDMVVKTGGVTGPLEVTVHDDAATLSCSLRTADDNAQAALVITSDSGRWVRTQMIVGKGESMLPSIPPGDYKVYAFDRIDHLEFRNPDALREYATKAVPITLGPDDKRSIKLDVITRGVK